MDDPEERELGVEDDQPRVGADQEARPERDHDEEQDERLPAGVARDPVREREPDQERRDRAEEGEPERAAEDLPVEGVPEGAVVVEVPGEGDVGEARQRSQAVRDDEPERDEEERGVPAQRRKREPARVAGAAAAPAAAPPCRYPVELRVLELGPDPAPQLRPLGGDVVRLEVGRACSAPGTRQRSRGSSDRACPSAAPA